ncbi:MAG: UvrD-helicase domain-containing protein [Tannerellaceae bacterium]|jgi:ATP-dependent exoDNAse (exonuclease V) beta subunit|nr:UvrD-helicase domain-containing protein [Tannerellaceae bacterium]
MLTVYRASAGAGKTHRLTGEYLRMLFEGGEGAFRNILAVTFTNKATDEMKSRIIQELHRLGNGRHSQYADELSAICSIPESEIRKKAKKMLTAILHDYGSFGISTIDRFFQQTMRAFVRDIGMQGGYTIELDDNVALTEAVDNMLNDLENNPRLLEWLLRFAAGKVEEGKGWDMRKDIMQLGKELFKENYKALCSDDQASLNKTELKLYRKDLNAIIASTEQNVRNIGEQGLALMRRFGLEPSDFINRTRSPFVLFVRLAKGEMSAPSATFIGLANNNAGWYSKTTAADIKARIDTAFSGGLNNCVNAVIALFNNLTDYHTAKESLRFYHALGILSDLSEQIAEWRTERNIMLIADTAELLCRIIDGSDAPFIYEKTGTRIDHYMIDEFQDTSRMQWHNFLPLLSDSLARGMSNLVVGDVKQSIYRFRNSDWKLLDEQIGKDFRPDLLREETLEQNWRSAENIIAFNNRMFEVAPNILQSVYNETLESSTLSEEKKSYYGGRIIEAYSNSRQSVPPPSEGSGGHVSVEYLLKEEGCDWRDEALNRLPLMIEKLQDAGYRAEDIAILTRKNKECTQIADALLLYKNEHPSDKYCYDIISDEALLVDRSPSVRFLLSMLRHLNAPADETCRRIAVVAYTFISDPNAGEGSLPHEFPAEIAAELEKLSKFSLYEATEGLLRLFDHIFPAGEHVFIQAFLDTILEFVQRENSDAERFLRWWTDTSPKRCIAMPDDRNAIRILTIHKAKGLGFRAVIIPFCDWEIDHDQAHPVTLWCRSNLEPFNRLPIVPLRYSSNLASTHFAEDYFEERLQVAIDNLNTMYVAFTRAKEDLLIMSPLESKKENKMGTISGLLRSALETGLGLGADELLYEQGASAPAQRSSSQPDGIGISMGRLSSVSPHDRLKLRLHSREFDISNPQRKHGKLMHEILSSILTAADISPAIEGYRLRGIINSEESALLADQLSALIHSPLVGAWFDGSAKVMNETEILSETGEKFRPDRIILQDQGVIIVDYKFGNRKRSEDRLQIARYMELVGRMGYPNVEGYLWYVSLGEVDKVEAE